ncbi:hypothetical protein [Bacillus sp. AFS031507]|uniref:hypothetical protein n=1 Tax=Bacillus sp. AFS031507 TaxID=2033496 RepID=UPI000BFCCDBB|nr:hypothetical protein [Bacillus sp. AFS031507]PGY07108.1 hypothetical protein COE25_25205 [Bacillus sp. AFS031507]
MKFNTMTEEEKRRLFIAMYFLHKGSHHFSRLHGEFMERETDEERKEAMEKRHNLFRSIAQIGELHLSSKQETEIDEMEKLEDEVYEWIEDNGFTEEVKKYFDKDSLMFS